MNSTIKLAVIAGHIFLAPLSAQTVPKIENQNLIISDEPFSEHGTIAMSEMNLIKKIEVSKTETGAINGVNYRFYYTDGSGFFSGTPGNVGNFSEPSDSNWSVLCKKDPISDQRFCYMKIKNLWIHTYRSGKVVVSIGSEHFPGSTVALRIDGGAPFTTSSANDGDFSTSTSTKIIEKLKTAKSVTTRYMKWPYKSWEDESWELYGFNETYKYISWAVKRIK